MYICVLSICLEHGGILDISPHAHREICSSLTIISAKWWQGLWEGADTWGVIRLNGMYNSLLLMKGLLWILSIFLTVPWVRVCTEVVFKSIYLYFALYLKYLLWNLLLKFYIVITIFCYIYIYIFFLSVAFLCSMLSFYQV